MTSFTNFHSCIISVSPGVFSYKILFLKDLRLLKKIFTHNRPQTKKVYFCSVEKTNGSVVQFG